jgi:hypothetical protein
LSICTSLSRIWFVINVVACYDCWARLLYKRSPTLRRLVEALPPTCDVKDDSGGYREEDNGSNRQIITKTMLLKYTAQCVLSKSVEKRLKLWPLCPTTIDNPEEHIGHLLSPIVRSTRSLTYWSSAGSGVSGDSIWVVHYYFCFVPEFMYVRFMFS